MREDQIPADYFQFTLFSIYSSHQVFKKKKSWSSIGVAQYYHSAWLVSHADLKRYLRTHTLWTLKWHSTLINT